MLGEWLTRTIRKSLSRRAQHRLRGRPLVERPLQCRLGAFDGQHSREVVANNDQPTVAAGRQAGKFHESRSSVECSQAV